MARRKTGNPTHKDTRDAAKASAFFTSSILDPHNPQHCGVCLQGAFLECTTAERATPNTDKRSKQPVPTMTVSAQLWTIVIAFLSLPRTNKQMEGLLVRLSTCSCRISDDKAGDLMRYHAEGNKEAARVMSRLHMEELGDSDSKNRFTLQRCAFIVDLFCVFSVVISGSSVRSAAKGSSQSWPISVTDLIPYGAENFVQAMMQWYRFVPDTIIFHATALVSRVCRSLVVPSLIQHQVSHAIIESTRQLVDLTMTNILSSDEKRTTYASHRFELHVTDLLIFLKVIMQELPQDCKAAILRGCETKAMQVCNMLLYLSSDPKMPSNRVSAELDVLAMTAQDIFRFFHMHMPPRPSMPVHPRVQQLDSLAFPPPASVRAPKESALSYIQDFRTEARCTAQGCPNSLQSAGREFQRCGRCGIVSYCGRECQAKAWKNEQYPHKRVCPVLRNLMEMGGGSALFFAGLHGRVVVDVKGEEKVALFLRMEAQFKILNNWTAANINEGDFLLIKEWGELVNISRGHPLPNGTEWTPGYSDYDEVIAQLSAQGRGPKPKYLNRLARWPSEVAKEERLLKVQPFWDHEIEC
ncbi:hypothetical protein GALMADRAFT_236816 [Galerina marginata CBS 339.88]|uniref:MYND-type domain-containing protein n=1 Tax=Galerina marginata (strain CBS 339.88) TaxID=685588 RepID=A0A067TP81_GALM3|nr:hypothetical protein GALMADRAFT_236816 [Galerina marginata CBS 339.88]